MHPERQGTMCGQVVTARAASIPEHLERASHEVRFIQGECVGICRAVRYSDGHTSGFCLRSAMIDSGLQPNPSFSESSVCPRE